MKIADKCRNDISAYLALKGSPQNANDVAFHLMPNWKTINTSTIVDTCRWLGFPVIGNMVYGLDD